MVQLHESYGKDGINRGVQPVTRGPHVAQDGYECGPAQNPVYLKHYDIFCVINIAVYLICGPRQLFIWCGPETPKLLTCPGTGFVLSSFV